MHIHKKKKLVFCLGTGRCGTSSLAALINAQEDALVCHELFPLLPWVEETRRSKQVEELVQYKFEQLTHLSHNYSIVGDSGSYYLPYVEVFVRSLSNSEMYDIKFVILKRDMHETIESFIDKFKKQNNNPLQNHDGPKNEWDTVFPKYEKSQSLETTLSMYYNDYYRESERLQQLYPKSVKIFSTDCLNNKDQLLDMFNFLGIRDPNIIIGVKKNSRELHKTTI